MSRAFNLDRYPKTYVDIAASFEDGKNEVVMGPFPSQAAAKNQRLDLYSFRAGLERAGWKDDYPRFAAVKMYVTPKAPWHVVLRHADSVLSNVKIKTR